MQKLEMVDRAMILARSCENVFRDQIVVLAVPKCLMVSQKSVLPKKSLNLRLTASTTLDAEWYMWLIRNQPSTVKFTSIFKGFCPFYSHCSTTDIYREKDHLTSTLKYTVTVLLSSNVKCHCQNIKLPSSAWHPFIKIISSHLALS